MQFFAAAFFLFLSFPLWSHTVLRTGISDIEPGTGPQEDTLVFLISGKVAKLSPGKAELQKRILDYKIRSSLLDITLDQQRYIISIDEIKSAQAEAFHLPFSEKTQGPTAYNPSVIESMGLAQKIFKESRYNKKESQCYNRAYVWAYEWRVKHNIFSSKVWLFFTRRYIRKNNFEWWFHVAPAFHVQDAGKVWLRIADVKYARSILKLKQWTDIFMKDNSNCPVVTKYSDQANFPESGSCFIMKSSMYYYQPIDLENLEKTSEERLIWNPGEIRAAYKEAFDLDV